MFSRKYLALALLVIFFMGLSSTTVGAQEIEEWNNDNRVVTRYGVIEGKTDEDAFSWLGIPYAKPPIENLRWKAPRDPESWNGVKKTESFGPPSVQHAGIMGVENENQILEGGIIGQENCLSLNIWRPKSNADNLPVYLFIHGGSNQVGWSGFPIYDGANLAKKANAIVVTINYRVGISGWFYHPSLNSGDSLDDSGNYGLLDIIQALEWVQNNIKRFGGDPNKVTVSGESAGAMNIYQMLMSPYVKENYFDKGKELFHRAVLESGLMSPTPKETAENNASKLLVKLLLRKDRASDENEAEEIIEDMDEKNIAGLLKNTSMENIYKCYEPTEVNAHINYGMGNYNDGYVIDNPYQRLIRGKYNKVPVIIGNNSEEGKLFLAMTIGKNFEKNQAFENAMFGKPHPNTLSSYLDNKYWSAFSQAGKWVTVPGFQTIGVETPASLMLHHQENVYVYRFAWDEEPEPFGFLIGASHAVEIPFIFNNIGENAFPFNNIAWSDSNKPGRKKLSTAIIKYWKNFMQTGDPNHRSLPKWKTWSNWPWSKRFLVLDAGETDKRIWMSDSFANEDKFLTSSENYLQDQMEEEGMEGLDTAVGFKEILEKAGEYIGGEDSEGGIISRTDILEKSLYLSWVVILIGAILAVVVYLGSGGQLS